MEDSYRLDNPTISCSNDTVRVNNYPAENLTAAVATDFLTPVDHLLQFDQQAADTDATGSHMSDLIKTQIAGHPRFPNLVSAYIECQKVGAPPELASPLEEIGRENHPIGSCSKIGADPELDEFMESYCEILHRYKEELSKPFDEATTFLSNIESQLSNLCKGALTKTLDYRPDEAAGTSDEEFSGGEVEATEIQESPDGPPSQDIKGMLMRRYSGYLSSLRKEFLKKRKKGKLPKDARMTLLNWWNNHYRWPYPTVWEKMAKIFSVTVRQRMQPFYRGEKAFITFSRDIFFWLETCDRTFRKGVCEVLQEEEKLKLSEITGLDQRQINNWFINQRKRHWKPADDMKFAILEGVAGNIEGPMYLDTGAGTGNEDV